MSLRTETVDARSKASEALQTPPLLKLVTPGEYLKGLIDTLRISGAGSDIVYRVMNFNPRENDVQDILAALGAVARAGGNVNLVIDSLVRVAPTGDVSLVPFNAFKNRKKVSEKRAVVDEALIEFKRAGGNIILSEPPDLIGNVMTPMGRSHMKIVAIKSPKIRKAWLTGFNLHGFDRTDIGAETSDPNLVTTLYDVARWEMDYSRVSDVEKYKKEGSIVRNRSTQDQAIYLPDGTTIYLDTNQRRFETAIYKEMVDVIAGAEHNFIFMSQLFPLGRLLHEAIKKSDEGIKGLFIFSRKDKSLISKPPYSILFSIFERIVRDHPNIEVVFDTNELHAKLVLADGGMDHAKVVLGSHNGVESGNMFGTDESALSTENEQVTADAYLFATSNYRRITDKEFVPYVSGSRIPGLVIGR